jgi:hypothetical protein
MLRPAGCAAEPPPPPLALAFCVAPPPPPRAQLGFPCWSDAGPMLPAAYCAPGKRGASRARLPWWATALAAACFHVAPVRFQGTCQLSSLAEARRRPAQAAELLVQPAASAAAALTLFGDACRRCRAMAHMMDIGNCGSSCGTPVASFRHRPVCALRSRQVTDGLERSWLWRCAWPSARCLAVPQNRWPVPSPPPSSLSTRTALALCLPGLFSSAKQAAQCCFRRI